MISFETYIQSSRDPPDRNGVVFQFMMELELWRGKAISCCATDMIMVGLVLMDDARMDMALAATAAARRGSPIICDYRVDWSGSPTHITYTTAPPFRSIDR